AMRVEVRAGERDTDDRALGRARLDARVDREGAGEILDRRRHPTERALGLARVQPCFRDEAVVFAELRASDLRGALRLGEGLRRMPERELTDRDVVVDVHVV